MSGGHPYFISQTDKSVHCTGRSRRREDISPENSTVVSGRSVVPTDSSLFHSRPLRSVSPPPTLKNSVPLIPVNSVPKVEVYHQTLVTLPLTILLSFLKKKFRYGKRGPDGCDPDHLLRPGLPTHQSGKDPSRTTSTRTQRLVLRGPSTSGRTTAPTGRRRMTPENVHSPARPPSVGGPGGCREDKRGEGVRRGPTILWNLGTSTTAHPGWPWTHQEDPLSRREGNVPGSDTSSFLHGKRLKKGK